jgi:hypothetical protein
MVDLGNVLFTLIPHFVLRGSVGLTMKLARVCVISLGCVGGAICFGVVANAAIDLVMPAPRSAVNSTANQTPVSKDVAAQAAPASGFALASATSTPAEITPVRVKTIPMLYREDSLAELSVERPAAPVADVPLPRARPASAPAMALAMAHGNDATASIARQPGSMAISAATRKAAPDDGDPLGAAGIERMKMALALTAEQEEYWPAIAAELRAIGKLMSKQNGKGQAAKINVDQDTIQRLYWAAAPLITRLSYEQKLKAKQMARLMGLTQVAEAL